MIFVLQVSLFSGRLFCDYFANQVASMKILGANLAPKVVVAWRVERSFFFRKGCQLTLSHLTSFFTGEILSFSLLIGRKTPFQSEILSFVLLIGYI